MPTTATLEGVPLMAMGDPSWELKTGVNPAEAFFFLPSGAADRFSRNANPVTLFIDDGKTQKQFKYLYVIEIRPGPNDQIERVHVVDRRWFWTRKHVERTYNLRRNVGFWRIKTNGGPELHPVEPDINYWEWTLIDGKQPWTARDVLNDVIVEAKTPEFLQATNGFSFPHIDNLPDSINQLPVENLELNENAAEALARVLNYLPDVTLYVNPEGEVVFQQRSSDEGKVIRILDNANNVEAWDSGHIAYVSSPLVMPSEIHVLFEPEVEVRFDFHEFETGTTSTWEDDDRYIENVLPIPDYQLTINGKTFVQGTWVTIAEYLSALPVLPRTGRALTIKDIRIGLMPGMDLRALVQTLGKFDPDADWMARIDAIQAHYRLTYRINPKWVNQCKKIGTYRISTINPERGTRANAEVFQDYCVFPGQRADVVLHAAGIEHSMALNVLGYRSTIDSDSKPSPFKVEMLDHDQGVFQLIPKLDVLKRFDAILPTKITTPVTANIQEVGVVRNLFGVDAKVQNVSFNSTVSRGEYPQMSAGHQASVILTLIPAGPNDTRRLFKVVMRPEDVRSAFPSGAAQEALTGAKGPVLELKVNPNIETARVRWLDSANTRIEAIFNIGISGRFGRGDDRKELQLDDIMLNKGPNAFFNGSAAASLDAIAFAAAARQYARYMPRNFGSAAFRFAPDVEPRGWMDEVRHTIGESGDVLTTVAFPDRIAEQDYRAFLPDDVRALVFHTVVRRN